jgi:hypothetical protein
MTALPSPRLEGIFQCDPGVLTGRGTFEELGRHEIESLYQQKKFPDLSDLACKEVIMK